MGAGKPLKREFFISARMAARRAGAAKKRVPASRNPSIRFELRKSVMGAGKPLKRLFFNSAREGGRARGRCEKRVPASRNPSTQAELRKSVMGAPKPLKRVFFISAPGRRQGTRARRKNALLRVEILRYGSSFESLLWERQSPRARILQQRAGRRQGTRARRKIHGEIAAVPFQETCAATGADAAFVPRIGRAPFSGRAADAKKTMRQYAAAISAIQGGSFS